VLLRCKRNGLQVLEMGAFQATLCQGTQNRRDLWDEACHEPLPGRGEVQNMSED
jgi:hypothetical protein